MVSGEIGRDLGPWSDADLRATTRANLGLGVDACVPERIRFRGNVVKLVRRRSSLKNANSDVELPAVFLLHPSPSAKICSKKLTRVPMLDNGRHELNGRVWFVGAGPGSGHFVPFDVESDDELFRFVTDDLGLGDVPTIVFEPRLDDPYLRHYPNGLNTLETFEDLSLSGSQITFDNVSQAIERTYSEKMKTPDAQPGTGKLWKNQRKWWPRRDAEGRVQMYLEIALNSAFPSCVIRSEQSIAEGRLDIEILEHRADDRSMITQHGVLELKVLRSFSESGAAVSQETTKQSIESGVMQASAYRCSKKAKWGALLCFDMRKDDMGNENCFKHVIMLSKRLDVYLRRWFMYATSRQLRSAMASR